jgi:hypothetical protein
MRRLEDGSIEIDSAYMASRLAIANGFNREADEHEFGLSLTTQPTLAPANEVTFYNKSLTDFSLTPEAMRGKLKLRSGSMPAEDSWYRQSWQPPVWPETWLESGRTPPGVWQEQTIIVGPERANVIETVLNGIIKGISLQELRARPGLEDFRTDLPSSAEVSEKLRMSKAEAEFILGTLNGQANLVGIEGLDIRQAA